ncbi:redoxin domain-containing protein [Gordonia pseudamarae]|jgi:thiol-disulfide isomerase/thioredoxin|uniref:Redoxin domain-containing protein n=1 Tax=Gordonia pseudamarae TaxID=2831662 RepID=A0ABX6IN28_9ACTN|nr:MULTISPECIES: TlpA disulfide reductase family protein [Gordonia]MBD0020655.1 TlpA family protein disulfide reductase [Gordonia sp. (in: high G+C Gram-positive bacteria)]QHN27698.1 redoxin domain-containing protein [Gordonia pseudamarae]QHN36580.1 redoxin domain-containing protein [Gordonia pseudamarae]
MRVESRRPPRTGRVGALIVSLLLAVCALAGCGTGDDAVAQGGTFQFVSPGGKTVITYDPADRKPVSGMSGPDVMTDATLSLADERFAGKVVVVNVWGQWCGPCRGEADALEKSYATTKDSGVEFLGINLRDDRQSARDFITDREVRYPSIYDFAGATLAAWKVPTAVLPTTIILDRHHRPAVVFLKSLTTDELIPAIERVAAEEPVPGAPVASTQAGTR